MRLEEFLIKHDVIQFSTDMELSSVDTFSEPYFYQES